MSIWTSVGEPVKALDGDIDDANYRGEGEPDLMIDVAVTEYHEHVRLSVSNLPGRTDNPRYMDAVLSEAEARELHARLGDALGLASVTWGSDGTLKTGRSPSVPPAPGP